MAQSPNAQGARHTGDGGQGDSRSQFPTSTPDGAGPEQTPVPADGRFCFLCSPQGSGFVCEGPSRAVITSLVGVCILLPLCPLPAPPPHIGGRGEPRLQLPSQEE